MQYPIIDLITSAYINNGWTGLDIPTGTITYEPIQLGSGDPSPDNVRPILPATTLNIGGEDFPIYSGSLDTSSRILTINGILETFNIVDSTLIKSQFNSFSNVSDGVSTIGEYTRVSFAVRDDVNQSIYNRVSSSYEANKRICNIAPHNFSYNEESTHWYRNTVLYLILPTSVVGNTAQSFYDYLVSLKNTNPLCFWMEYATPITYQLTEIELENALGIKDEFSHRLKLPLPHYFPHPVIDALQRAAAGTQTADDTEILRHYLTPLGIGGI